MSTITRYGRITPDILDRIWEKIEVEGDCWLWTAGVDADGYPRIGMNKRARLVHIIFYELDFGMVEDRAMQVGHTHCYNKLCVAPNHKTLYSQSENMLEPDRLDTGDHEYFICGHPRIPSNQIRNGKNSLRCRTCNRENHS